jgi:hypothetical protein
VTSSSEAAGQSGSGKSGDTASPVAPPAGAAASPAIDRGLSGSPVNLYGYLPSGAPGAAGATDATGSPSPQPEAASSSLSVPGILAAISLGVLLLGLVLLIRSRARPFDSAG